LIDQDSFALGDGAGLELDGGEFGEMVSDWQALERRMLTVKDGTAAAYLDSYYQLLEYPISAMANLYRLYYAVAWNRRLAAKNDPRANVFADEVEAAFRRDRDLMTRYHSINGGKWDGMMTQVHMSYVIWNDPTQQTMPTIMRVGGDTPADRLSRKILFKKPAPAAPGIIAVEAAAFSRARNGEGLVWTAIPNLGRTQGAVLALPQGRPATTLKDAVYLEYNIAVDISGPALVQLYLAPTLSVSGSGGFQVGVSIGDGPVRVLSSNLRPTGGTQTAPDERLWADAVRNNISILSAEMGALSIGRHTVKVWRLDDNVVLQKLVVSTTPLTPTYLGPPSSAGTQDTPLLRSA
jgi:hypothetical protein